PIVDHPIHDETMVPFTGPAIAGSKELDCPLLILEPLRAGYRWASERHHRFVMDGMIDNRAACEGKAVTYYPYLENAPGEGAGLLEALAKDAACVVSDDYPAFFIPRMHDTVAKRLGVRFELVDSNGILPLRATDRVFPTAYSFRGYLQKNVKPFVGEAPKENPLARLRLPKLSGPPRTVTQKWPVADLDGIRLGTLQIDHSVAAVDGTTGGSAAAGEILRSFLGAILPRYGEDRNEPERRGTSQLSPHLHFGHISVHEVFAGVAKGEKDWSVDILPDKGRGSREGWWKMSGPAEGFLDELITWRELGYNMASKIGQEYEEYASLPEWAQATLDVHRDDPRDYVYSLDEFENAQTHDTLWNAAQNQLVRDGRIHNYLRML
ncbi:MAG: deoxyribodipyrimidine photolyase, partial [Myxococcota bacterium]